MRVVCCNCRLSFRPSCVRCGLRRNTWVHRHKFQIRFALEKSRLPLLDRIERSHPLTKKTRVWVVAWLRKNSLPGCVRRLIDTLTLPRFSHWDSRDCLARGCPPLQWEGFDVFSGVSQNTDLIRVEVAFRFNVGWRTVASRRVGSRT